MKDRHRGWGVGRVAVVLASVAAAIACTPSPPTLAPTAPGAKLAAAAASPTPLVLNNTQLTAIQPGLGTVMVEYGRRMAAAWFGEQAGNWEMAKYQVAEMREIQEVGEITRPGRAQALKAFELAFLDPLAKAIDAKDANGFTTAYNNAINGCNGCHGSQTSADFPTGYGFVKVQVPKDTFDSLYSWK